MRDQFQFKNLFTLDLANNHQGDVNHGLRIIREMASVIHKHRVRTAFKFQFRELDSFIHPNHQKNSENHHIPRFLANRLSREEFQTLLDEVRKQDLLSMCTPFDEASVDAIVEMGFDIIKVASCSAKDWPLLGKIVEAGKPVIFSTGGLLLSDIDNLVSFFEHQGVDFAIMHCVSVYPTPDELLNLNQIDVFRNRYRDQEIGWSTHEEPDDTVAIQIAVAKGATLFERHVGIATDKIKLNAYSSTPEQIDRWIEAYQKAIVYCGHSERPEPKEIELSSLRSLERGIYAKEPIESAEEILPQQVYFAMPCLEGQLISGKWKPGIKALEAIALNGPVLLSAITEPPEPKYHDIKHAVHDVKALLNEAKIPLNNDFSVEFSHHYGMKSFRKTGAIIINCINRSYCKKIVAQLPGQEHPSHFHKKKEETFHVLYGVLHIELDNKYLRVLHPGETVLIQPGVWHSFWTENGVIFEEISTTHYNDDSYYKERAINKIPRSDRKTLVDSWGRFQFE